jgi:hypothetical protein
MHTDQRVVRTDAFDDAFVDVCSGRANSPIGGHFGAKWRYMRLEYGGSSIAQGGRGGEQIDSGLLCCMGVKTVVKREQTRRRLI